MTVRYFVPEFPASGGSVVLPESESHHASAVMRVRVGDHLTLFDGQGFEAEAVVASVGRKSVVCQAGPKHFLPRGNPTLVELGIAMPKGDRCRDLVERLTELGVNRLVPIHCQRSPWQVSQAAITKWNRAMIEACKQCRRNQIMEITAPCRATEFLQQPPADNAVRWFAHPGAARLSARSTNAIEAPSTFRIAVGPEGGFTDQEVDIANAAGWQAIGLGDRIYRIETAAIVLAVKATEII